MAAWQTLRRIRGATRSRRHLTGAGRTVLCIVLAGSLTVLAPGSTVAQPPPGAQGPPPGIGGGPFTDLELQLDFGMYIHGCRDRQGIQDLAVDPAGNTVLVGFIPRDCDRGEPDIVVSKHAPDGTFLFRRELGGIFADIPNGVALDSEGNIYVTGATQSDITLRPFPVVDPFQGDNAGEVDAFVMKLDPEGETLLYSTFLGGASVDVGTDVVVDDAGRIVVVGTTDSPDFPTIAPLQPALAGGSDAFVAVFEPDGSDLAFSTYFGGVGDDRATRLALLRDRIVFTGATGSPDLPARVPGRGDVLDPVYGGGASDAFVARIDRLERLGYAGFLGGAGEDAGYGVALDRSGSAHVTGVTDSADFPTARPLQEDLTGPEADAFLTKLNPSGSNARYSTYIETEDSAACQDFDDLRPGFCAAVDVDGDGTTFVTVEGFFAKAVSKNGRRLLDAREGFGGTTLEVADDGSVFVAGISEDFDLPLANQPEPPFSLLLREVGWLVRLTRSGESGAGGGSGSP